MPRFVTVAPPSLVTSPANVAEVFGIVLAAVVVIVGVVATGVAASQVMSSSPKFAKSEAVITILSTSSKFEFAMKIEFRPATVKDCVPEEILSLKPSTVKL